MGYDSALSLVSSMLKNIPSDRPTIADVLNAPLFWPKKAYSDFLRDCGEMLNAVARTSSLGVRLDRHAASVVSRNWISRLPGDLKECFDLNVEKAREKKKKEEAARKQERTGRRGRKSRYIGGYDRSSVASLVIFARNALTHDAQLPTPQGNLSPRYYFTKCLLNTFPKLLMVVYEHFNVEKRHWLDDFVKNEVQSHWRRS